MNANRMERSPAGTHRGGHGSRTKPAGGNAQMGNDEFFFFERTTFIVVCSVLCLHCSQKKCRQGWTTLVLPFDTCPVPTSMQNKATITMWGFNTNSASRSIDAYGVVKFMFSQPFIYLFTLATFFTTIVPVPIDDSTFTSQLALKLCRDPYFVPGASSTLCVIV